MIYESYGATEGAGTLVSPEEWLRFPGTVGRPLPATELRILDEKGREVPTGCPGTIYMTRHTGDTFEYNNDPKKTNACHRGNLFTVGDMGYVNEEGYLFLCGRGIEMIIVGGMNIYPAEVEQVLIGHPNVADCAVFGIPDEFRGEAVVAAVQADTPPVSAEKLAAELLAFAGRYLAPAKLPTRFVFTASLGRDGLGKLNKGRLRQQYLARLREQ